MEVPEYLKNILIQAEDELQQPDETPGAVAQRIAARHTNLTSRLRGERHRDNLNVLKDIREIHQLCADELEHYRKPSTNSATNGEATIEALTQRSLEDLIHTHLSEEQRDFL